MCAIFLEDPGINFSDKIILHGDNFVSQPLDRRNKVIRNVNQIEVRHHFVLECFKIGIFSLKYVNSCENSAETLMKTLYPVKYLNWTRECRQN